MDAVEAHLNEYKKWVSILTDRYDEDSYGTAGMFAVIGRDWLEDHWGDLSETQKEQVLHIDSDLVTASDLMDQALPMDPSTDENRARGRWWWFLDEGPQVRETIGKA